MGRSRQSGEEARPVRTGLERKLRRALAKLALGRDQCLVVGVSGGADSTALLDALEQGSRSGWAPEKIVVAHLNHLLRSGASDDDELFVRSLAGRYGFPCEVERLRVDLIAGQSGSNLEATARLVRYDFLRRVALANQSRFVCTAHTLDDQAETVLMRLLRGSGTLGLTGIPEQRGLGEGVTLLRPLIDVSRGEVLEHCRTRLIEYREDESNLSTEYMRNRIRHELLAQLRTYNPGISATLVRTADLLREDDAYLREVASESRRLIERDGGLSIDRLQSLASAIRRRVLRDWIADYRGGLERVSAAHLASIEKLLAEGQSGRRIELPGRLVAIRDFDLLRLVQKSDLGGAESEARSGQLSPESTLELLLGGANAGRLQCFGRFGMALLVKNDPPFPPPPDVVSAIRPGMELIGMVAIPNCPELNALRVRTRRPGDLYNPAGMCHRMKVKTLMIRHKIPRWTRDTYPVVVTDDDRIVWVPGMPVAREFDHRAEENRARPRAWLLALVGNGTEKLASEKCENGLEYPDRLRMEVNE